ncbi:MAG: hypothetical protein ABIN58_08955 [candidate division WOR-3 bacterium]
MFQFLSEQLFMSLARRPETMKKWEEKSPLAFGPLTSRAGVRCFCGVGRRGGAPREQSFCGLFSEQ